MKKRKNVLFILADQQRMDTVSAYGLNDICRTPNIDALAANGMKFTNAFTPSPICAPARASLMTGLFPHTHGTIDNFLDFKDDIPLLSECMSKAGYYCGYAGKWHIHHTKTPKDCGFEDGKPFMGYGFPGSGVFKSLIFNGAPTNKPNYYEEYLKENNMYPVDVSEGYMGDNPDLQVQEMFTRHDGPLESTVEYFVAQETCRLIEKASKDDRPFFLWSNFWGPHSPSIVPEPYFSMYNPADIPEHPSYCETFEGKPYGQYLTEKYWGLGNAGWPGFAEIAARYYGHCTMLDDLVGMIVDKLKELGMFEDTVIVYTADHGDCMGAHKFIEKGPFMYDEINRIPMIVSGLGNKDNDSMVYLHELMPTALEIAGVEPEKPVQGESLLPLMSGEKECNGRDHIFGEFHRHFYIGRQRYVRTRKYQFTFNESEIGELYDLEKDPFQLHNVCYDPAYADVKAEMIELMHEDMKKLHDPAIGWFHAIRKFY